ncbi:MAG: nucleotide exchange factor GrpE [Mogibacterium sp.]|nr:nucleotide exchange factor GrpE [Mogibacterium sp.]
MSEDKKKQIHIEDAAEEEKAGQAEAEAAEVSEEAADGSGEAEEKTSEAGSNEEGEKAGDEAEADAKAAEEQESERYMRLMAEFQNFKRRAAKEKTDIHAYANEKIIGDLLPVLDNFERALSTDGGDIEAYAKGMELIFEQLKTALGNAGLSEIEAMDKEFDPNVHNAVMTETIEDAEDGVVTKVLQKGYKLRDRVIRPSMVAVNKK